MFMKEMIMEYKTKTRNMQKGVRDERSNKKLWAFLHHCIQIQKSTILSI